MTDWTPRELEQIGTAEELQVITLKKDGTRRSPVVIWVVRAGDGLYVRSWRGSGGAWFRAVKASHAGRIQAGGVGKDVTFVEETDPGINAQVDTAYRTKYRRYPSYVPPMIAQQARETTLKLIPAK